MTRRRVAVAWMALAVALALPAGTLPGATDAGIAPAEPAGATTDGVDLAVTATATGVSNGATTVEITVRNEGDVRAVAPVVTVGDLPAGWTVTNTTSHNGTYRSSTRQFLWFTLEPGASASATVTIAVPENASGSHEIPVRVDDEANHTAATTATVTVGGGDRLSGALLPVAGLLAVSLAGLGAYLYRRRRRGGRRRG